VFSCMISTIIGTPCFRIPLLLQRFR
jgi:hypothetical protein